MTMDKLQRTFTSAYVIKLINDVKSGVSIDMYSAREFNIDEHYCPLKIANSSLK